MIICIVHDYVLFGQALKNLMHNTYTKDEIKLYNNAKDFLKEIRFSPTSGLVITDLLMPGMNGIEIMLKAKELHPGLKFIFLSTAADTNKVRECIKKGASAYLSKDASEQELISAIEAALNGKNYLNNSLKNKWIENIFTGEEPVSKLFSPRENEVMHYLCAGKSPKEIAHEMGLSLNTIQQYIRGTMRKAGVKRTTELVLYAIQKGLYTIVSKE